VDSQNQREKTMIKRLAAVVVACVSLASVNATADQLDTVIKRGTLNCGVVLDFPPMGYFDSNNDPAGFDVDYCNDLASALGVDANVLNLTWGDRIPSLVSGKTDVVVGSTSDTLERAKSVGFTYPYFVFKFQVISNKDKNIDSFDDLENLKVGAALGTTYETEFLAYAEQNGWDTDNYTAFQSENDAFLGLYQGKVDAIISTNTNIATKLRSEEFADFAAGPFVPNYDDVVGLIAKRSETAWINYLNLFLVRQIRDGNLDKRYNQHFGSDAPADLIQSLRDNK
jgi:polar amino acid transport system substrate-binding protein